MKENASKPKYFAEKSACSMVYPTTSATGT
jgi:hypothetical protein